MPFSSVSEYKIVGTNIIGGHGIFKNAGGSGSIVLGNDSAQFGASDSIFLGFQIGGLNRETGSIIIGNRAESANATGEQPSNNVIIGNEAGTPNSSNVLIGTGVFSNGWGTAYNNVAVGAGAASGGSVNGSVLVGAGAGALTTCLNSAIIGSTAQNSYIRDGVIIGNYSVNFCTNIFESVSIGNYCNDKAALVDSVTIGTKIQANYADFGYTLNHSAVIGSEITLFSNKSYSNVIVLASRLTDIGGTVIPDNSVILGNSGANYLNFGQGKLVYQSASGLNIQGGLSVSGGASNFTRVNLSSALYAFDLVITTYFYTVATLPAPSATLKGARAFVSDLSNALTFGNSPVGGGTQAAPVWCDGVNWRIG